MFSSMIPKRQTEKQNSTCKDINGVMPVSGNKDERTRLNCSILKWLADCDTGLIPTAGEREEGLDGVTDVRWERCLEHCSHSSVTHREVSFLDA